ncbi:MAG: histidine phosphatase family protein [Sphingomonadaceae bacterium]|nr:histidine phosphatase family protein [Sphingomonadaceae bacterium]
MSRAMFPAGRLFIARHGETVFNAAARMQGNDAHTPLTRRGFAQADAMGEALLGTLGREPALELWASDTGRALQTLAVIAEHLGLDWHSARTDRRLAEIGVGRWEGRYYADVTAEQGEIFDRATGLFSARPPEGEWYDGIAERLTAWLRDLDLAPRDRLVITHGITSRVLRGLLAGCDAPPGVDAPVAPPLAQGSLVMIEDGVETLVRTGEAFTPA